MVIVIFRVFKVHYSQSMILELIHPTHHVYQTDQVLILLFISNLSLCQGNTTSWQYGEIPTSPKSSLTILSGSLASNRTYQFMVLLKNRQNSSLQATGYLLVQIKDTQSHMIAIT